MESADSRFLGLRERRVIWWLLSARRRAIARPMPRLPPVMRACGVRGLDIVDGQKGGVEGLEVKMTRWELKWRGVGLAGKTVRK